MMTLEDIIHLLKNSKTSDEIDEKREDIASVIPAAREMFGYDQMNAAHQYDLWLHCVNTVLNLPENLDDDMLYLAALLHDIGKPECRCKSSCSDTGGCTTDRNLWCSCRGRGSGII